MNKRIRRKIAKRENGGVLPATSTPKAAKKTAPKKKTAARGAKAAPARAATAPQGAAAPTSASAPTGAVEKARAVVENVVNQAQEKVANRVADLKDKLHETEQQAEEALSKIPIVGKAAAKKLHDLTK